MDDCALDYDVTAPFIQELNDTNDMSAFMLNMRKSCLDYVRFNHQSYCIIVLQILLFLAKQVASSQRLFKTLIFHWEGDKSAVSRTITIHNQ